jgi:CRISPR-associated endonuclease/helicase Cas3
MPSENKSDAMPYDIEILKSTYQTLPDEALMKERNAQQMIDSVYIDNKFVDINLLSAFKDGQWQIKELWHNPKSALLETLDIDSVTCIDQADREIYENATYEEQSKMEIPVPFRSIGYAGLDKMKTGSKPFVIPSKAYDEELGFLGEYAKPEFYDVTTRFL